MRDIASLLGERKAPTRPPPHEHAASVNEILAFMRSLPKERQMPRGFWDRKVAGCNYGDVVAILKKAGELPLKYSKGGFISNRLRELARG